MDNFELIWTKTPPDGSLRAVDPAVFLFINNISRCSILHNTEDYIWFHLQS